MKEKAAKVKKEIPKKEKVAKILWIVFTVILALMIFFRFIAPSMLASGNRVAVKTVANIAFSIMDESIEYTNDKGETHKYYISLDNDYFKKGSKSTTPILIEREEADGSRTKFSDESFKPEKDKDFGDERFAVIARFANNLSGKFGFDVYDLENMNSNEEKESPLKLDLIKRVTTDIFIFYLLFYIGFSIYAYYQIWSRRYDEKLALEEEARAINEEYQKGVSREQAELSRKPKKLTKKQKRELNKK